MRETMSRMIETMSRMIETMSRAIEMTRGEVKQREWVVAVVLISFWIVFREDLWILRKLSLGFLIHQRGGKSFSWMINHSVGREEPVIQFSRVFWLGRNWGYGGTRWVVMIMWLTIYRSTKKENFDGLCKRPQEMVWDRISKKRNFDRLYKQVMWPTKNENYRGICAYISRSCDLPKKENFWWLT